MKAKRCLFRHPPLWINVTIAFLFGFSSLFSVSSLAGTRTYFIHTDHLGTPQVLTDKDQMLSGDGSKRRLAKPSVRLMLLSSPSDSLDNMKTQKPGITTITSGIMILPLVGISRAIQSDSEEG